jgi:hypothetical protein
MTGRMEFTQEVLRAKDEICSLDDLYATGHSNSRNDISELAREHGWEIESWLMRHDETQPFHKHYRLIVEGRPTTEPRIPVQQRLLGT